jgi:hypothetical protein
VEELYVKIPVSKLRQVGIMTLKNNGSLLYKISMVNAKFASEPDIVIFKNVKLNKKKNFNILMML